MSDRRAFRKPDTTTTIPQRHARQPTATELEKKIKLEESKLAADKAKLEHAKLEHAFSVSKAPTSYPPGSVEDVISKLRKDQPERKGYYDSTTRKRGEDPSSYPWYRAAAEATNQPPWARYGYKEQETFTCNDPNKSCCFIRNKACSKQWIYSSSLMDAIYTNNLEGLINLVNQRYPIMDVHVEKIIMTGQSCMLTFVLSKGVCVTMSQLVLATIYYNEEMLKALIKHVMDTCRMDVLDEYMTFVLGNEVFEILDLLLEAKYITTDKALQLSIDYKLLDFAKLILQRDPKAITGSLMNKVIRSDDPELIALFQMYCVSS